MKRPQLHSRHDPVPYYSYVIGFLLSVIATLIAYFLVVYDVISGQLAVATVLFIAVVQLVIQLVFFLHIGRGSHWKLISFIFAAVVVLVVVVGSLWIMNNLDYNMMHMTPDQMNEYMEQNEGL